MSDFHACRGCVARAQCPRANFNISSQLFIFFSELARSSPIKASYWFLLHCQCVAIWFRSNIVDNCDKMKAQNTNVPFPTDPLPTLFTVPAYCSHLSYLVICVMFKTHDKDSESNICILHLHCIYTTFKEILNSKQYGKISVTWGSKWHGVKT